MACFDIPTPCHEDWEKMTPEEKGRHCEKCAKTVFDVTQWSDEKVFDEYNKNGQSLCIRVPEDRLTSTTSNRTWKYYVVAFLASLWFMVKKTFVNATPDKAPDDVATSKDTLHNMVVHGTILDSLQGAPMTSTEITLLHGDQELYNTVSDNEGKFNFSYGNDTLTKGDTLTLKISHLGYEIVRKDFTPKDTIQADIFMKESHVCLNEMVITRDRGTRIIQGDMVTGIAVFPPHPGEIKIYRKLLDDYDTKTIHHDELERLNLRN